MNGCEGAAPHAYPQWFANNGGVSPHEGKYMYLDRNPKLNCGARPRKWNSGAKVVNNVFDFQCNAEKMKAMVAKYGAVGAGITVEDSFENYKSGIFQGCRYLHVDIVE